jgi:hypothetical protein
MAGGYNWQPPYEQMLMAEIRKLQNQIDALRQSVTGFGLQIDPQGDLIFDGSRGDLDITNGGNLNVDGNLAVGGTETVTGNLVVSGTETVGGTLHVTGNTVIDGTLALPAGIIGNDALANPVRPATAHNDAAGYSLTTTATEKARVTISVPSGFSQALVMGSINATAKNTSAAQDFLDGYVDIIGLNPGYDSLSDGPTNASIGIANVSTALLTGLGSTFYVRAMLRSGSASWTADSINSVNVDALVLFLR